MKDLVLYCKSYHRDFLRLKGLLASITEYNVDQIPFYISTPNSDKALLEKTLGTKGYLWLADEEIVASNPRADVSHYRTLPGGLSQQVVKAEFWRLGYCSNYLCLDSDSQFIRQFKLSDFVSKEGVPYTVLHQNKEFFQIAENRGHQQIQQDLRMESECVKALFDREGPNFYCAPAPFNWSARVWQSLDEQYLQPRNMTLWDLISAKYPESLIYGEALMKYRAIPLIAIEPLFRTYHYDWQYFLMKRFGETEERLKNNYLGVIYQSNWNPDTDFGGSTKSFLSRCIRRIKRSLRYLNSYL